MKEEDGLGTEMGVFGGGHRDDNDSTLSLSNMTVLSDLAPGMEPGRFHLLGIGVYAQLHTFSSIFFSGRVAHGGTAPLGLPGQDPPPWSARCVVIGYPSGPFINGTIRQAMAVVPFRQDPLYLSPEMCDVK